ncbi:hypothetical protein RJT34_30740 [Clitoria ternatea]|uniref:Peptidase A1 domain-containing protein n=1 Tax=Clitoria ternatea TaxID=43366 RepID=A0AAN9I4B9_CLITE
MFFVLSFSPSLKAKIGSNSSADQTETAKGFNTDIFNRDSPLSPFFNASMNKAETTLVDALTSVSRAKFDLPVFHFRAGCQDLRVMLQTTAHITWHTGMALPHLDRLNIEPTEVYLKRGKIKFANEATIWGKGIVISPLIKVTQTGLYHLNLIVVRINDVTVSAIASSDIIIDSGASLTILEANFYDQDDMWCVAIISGKDLFSIGNLAQVNYKVEYDIDDQVVSFLPADCTKE